MHRKDFLLTLVDAENILLIDGINEEPFFLPLILSSLVYANDLSDLDTISAINNQGIMPLAQ